jgi:uncharacterized protein (TIGR02145 family)
MEKDDIVKHICGGNSIEACNEHYNAECGDDGGDGNSITYEGETYPTVVIGTQTWFAKNLNYAVAGSKCYDNDPDYCQEYGRLYDWETALGVCPSGWHLPSNDDWDRLMDYVGGSETAGAKLKSISGWNNDGNGTGEYGFSALPGGLGLSDGSFYDVGSGGYWCSATGSSAGYFYGRYMAYSFGSMGRSDFDKSGLFSVRCVKD